MQTWKHSKKSSIKKLKSKLVFKLKNFKKVGAATNNNYSDDFQATPTPPQGNQRQAAPRNPPPRSFGAGAGGGALTNGGGGGFSNPNNVEDIKIQPKKQPQNIQDYSKINLL